MQPSRDHREDTMVAIKTFLKTVEGKRQFSEKRSSFRQIECRFHPIIERVGNGKGCCHIDCSKRTHEYIWSKGSVALIQHFEFEPFKGPKCPSGNTLLLSGKVNHC